MDELNNYTGVAMQANPPLTKGIVSGKIIWFIAPDGNAYSVDKDGFCHSWFMKQDIPLHTKTLEAYYGVRLECQN